MLIIFWGFKNERKFRKYYRARSICCLTDSSKVRKQKFTVLNESRVNAPCYLGIHDKNLIPFSDINLVETSATNSDRRLAICYEGKLETLCLLRDAAALETFS